MKHIQVFRKKRKPWFYIGMIISLGFLVLSLMVWVLGGKILEDNSERILEQRLVIVQLIADELDRKLDRAVKDLEQLRLLADFNPDDSDLNNELEVLSTGYQNKGNTWEEIIFLNSNGEVILSYPSAHYLRGTNLSNISYITGTLQSQSVQISTPFQASPNEDNLFVRITVPIFDENEFLGVLSGTLVLDEEEIFATLQDAIWLGKTAHAILVDEQGRTLVSTFGLPFLSSAEHPTFYRKAIEQGEAIVETVPFELEFPNEPLGHLHVMAFVPLKTVKWGVSMGGDVVEETFAGLRRLSILLVLFSALSILGVWAVAMLSTKRVLAPVGETVEKFDLIRNFATAKSWENLVEEIVQVPSKIVPLTTGAYILLFDSHINEFELIAQWNNQKEGVIWPPSLKTLEICSRCSLKKPAALGAISSCENQIRYQSSSKHKGYCLQLIHQENLVGILHFYLPKTEKLSNNQMEVLTAVASDMAIAIESFQLQRSNLNRVDITQTERTRIAQHLHDTLGQNISYLRLKLDQFTGDDALSEITAIRKELEKMREVADETYHQVRGTLETLQADTTPHLDSALMNQARKFGGRNNFEIEFIHEGRPYPLQGPILRQILDITKEIFGNIEKHANATHVILKTVWGDGILTVTIADNGEGFNMDEVDVTKHFGLTMMQERVEKLNGHLKIVSAENEGTEISITLGNSLNGKGLPNQ